MGLLVAKKKNLSRVVLSTQIGLKASVVWDQVYVVNVYEFDNLKCDTMRRRGMKEPKGFF